MKTNVELETLIQNLIERMNRVEANVGHSVNASIPYSHDPVADAIDRAVVMIEKAAEAHLPDRLNTTMMKKSILGVLSDKLFRGK